MKFAAISVATAAVLIASPATTYAADMTAYGFEFGKPIPLRECQRLRAQWGGAFIQYENPKGEPCLEYYDEGKTSDGLIAFPFAQGAALASTNKIGFRSVDGNLNLLVIWTNGATVQKEVFDTLIAKYGKPSDVSTVPMSNAYGVRYESLGANWHFEGLAVQFRGITARINSGLLLIGTPDGIERYHARLNHLDKRQKL